MKKYLHQSFDWNRSDLVSQYDELPLWSSPFGLILLDNIPLGKYDYFLDIGCGTGFPLIQISQRLGANCKSFGVDPWNTAVLRARSKINTLGLSNIEIIRGDASKLPFAANSFDLITSNLGINNFGNPFQVLSECNRVIKPDASLCITTNLTGHFQEFYTIYSQTLDKMGLYTKYKKDLENHIQHRGTPQSHISLLEKSGFVLKKLEQSQYSMRFFNGTTFLNNSFIISAFMETWRNLIAENEREEFFDQLEVNLNKISEMNGELKLSIPMAYLECVKI